MKEDDYFAFGSGDGSDDDEDEVKRPPKNSNGVSQLETFIEESNTDKFKS